MNNVVLVGRIGRDIDLKTSQSGVEHCAFSIAVDRRFKNQNGERETDWINIKAWRQTATFIAKYFQKGSKIGIIGTIQTGSYEKDGRTVYTTDVVAESAYFVESASKQEPSNQQYSPPTAPVSQYTADDTSLPFDL